MDGPTIVSELESSSADLAPEIRTIAERIEREQSGREARLTGFFLRLLQDHFPVDFFRDYSPDDLLGLIRFFRNQLREYREEPSYRLNLLNPTPDTHGWSAPYSVINLVIDDHPFVVDSIYEYLEKSEITIRWVFSSRLRTRWSEAEQLEDLSVEENGEMTFMTNFQVERVEEDRLEQLRGGIERVLEDLELAVGDFEEMLERARSVRSRLGEYEAHLPERAEWLEEARFFMEFLIEGNFVFLGYREYNLQTQNGTREVEIEHGSGRGILRREEQSSFYRPRKLDELPAQLKERMTSGPVIHVTKANAESRVYRREPLDYVGIKRLDDTGELTGEYRFLGLFTNRVLADPSTRIPILRKKFEEIVEREKITEHTHRYREFYSIFSSMPKHVLFTSSVDEIIQDISTVIQSYTGSKFNLRVRPDAYQRGLWLMVLMSRERFNSEVRGKIQRELEQEFEPQSLDYHLSLGQAESARLHFYLQTDRRSPRTCSFEELEHRLYEMTRSWRDRFLDRINEHFSGEEAKQVRHQYRDAFPEEYQVLVPPSLAVHDVENIQRLRSGEEDPGVDMINPPDSAYTHLNLYSRQRFGLSEIMPLLTNHGLNVVEQSTVEVQPDGESFYVHLFRVQHPEGKQIPLSERKQLLIRSIRGVWTGRCRNDIINELVTDQGLTPKAVNLFRLYKNYFHQLQPAIKLESINRILISHPVITASLFRFFEDKFDPEADADERARAVEEHKSSIETQLEEISERTDYQILHSIFNHIDSTVRTNYYQDDQEKPYISVKVECRRIEEMPAPRPLYEIYVYSPYMEAIHLRGGKIARGGIRWSDRRDDFRTEVLDLMKTQMVKNALIVPVGSKGGFVLKQEHLQADDLRQAAREQYRVFMRGMLDLTDNLVEGEVHRPPDVVCYDEDDPYLVVAADKGTAHFSDTANQVAGEYDFWLSDAFASGGSVGYDHKELGITAKGGWECVRRHFREMGRDIQRETFTALGIGDMGGDVFGNGMILSDKMKLLGAFNHRHIFLDPDPDPASSFKERKRLFESNEASGWDAYDPSVISEGGGVFDRNSREIELPEASRQLLGIETEQPGGEEIIRALLKVEADLLWNGGIGTYIKGSDQSHAEVGDPQNNDCRVDADEVQARVIGEGGNLGITQEGRIELARRGVRLNTDALDNSGGVDLSDHEVNLKILLHESIKRGELPASKRESFLIEMTDPIVAEVIRDNYEQSGVISFEVGDSEKRMDEFRHLISSLEETVNLDREVEVLPDERELQERMKSGEGMTRPELSVLLAYVKMDLYRSALQHDWSEEWIIQPFLEEYFPDPVIERLPEGLRNHPLRREIALTNLVNYAVHFGGFTFFYRLGRELGAEKLDVLVWYLVADQLGGAQSLRNHVFELDDQVPPSRQYETWKNVQLLLERAVGWLHDSIRPGFSAPVYIGRMSEKLSEHRTDILDHIGEQREERMQQLRSRWSRVGLGEDFQQSYPKLYYLVPTLDVLHLHAQVDAEVSRIAEQYFALGSVLNIDWLIHEVIEAQPQGQWDQYAFRNLTTEINQIQHRLTRKILVQGESAADFADRNRGRLDRLEEVKGEIERDRENPYAAYQFLVQRIRGLV